jgi:hypothetical protein
MGTVQVKKELNLSSLRINLFQDWLLPTHVWPFLFGAYALLP